MLRAVADTNVSALNFGGLADDVLALGRAHRVRLIVSPPILAEIEGVLVRKFRWSAARARDALTAIQTFAEVVHPRTTVTLVAADESDNRVIECALDARAHVIVTGDRHLRDLHTVHGIATLSPRQFLDVYPALAQRA